MRNYRHDKSEGTCRVIIVTIKAKARAVGGGGEEESAFVAPNLDYDYPREGEEKVMVFL